MVTKFRWNPEKNIRLQNQRGISFEMIVAILDTGKYEVLQHPTRPSQKIATFIFEGYPWDVPFVEQDDGSIFLKTAYPNRKRK
jgi:hypothetical protein